MRVPEFLKTKIFTQDTGEFRFRYLLFPPTGRWVIDIVFDLLSLASIIGLWLGYFLHISPRMPILATLVILICVGNAYRNFSEVSRYFTPVPIDGMAKVRYVHQMHAMAFGAALFSLYDAFILETGIFPLYLHIVCPIAVLIYLIALPYIFKTTTLFKQHETND